MGKLLPALLLFSLVHPLHAYAQCIDSLIDTPSWRDAGSKPIIKRLKKHTVPISKITVHFTGSKKNPNLDLQRKLKGLYGFSINKKNKIKKKLWGDVPYNFYIDMNGKSARGRDPAYQPDTNTKYNPNGHLTIVVEGDSSDKLAPTQKKKLFDMLKGLQNKYNLPTSAVGIHKHYASTDCPGRDVEAAIQEYKRSNSKFRPNPKACSAGSPRSGGPGRTINR